MTEPNTSPRPLRHQLAHMTKRCASPRPLRYKSKGPTKPGGIKTQRWRPKAAVRRPNGSPHDGTKYKSKTPSVQSKEPNQLGRYQRRKPAAEGRCEETQRTPTWRNQTQVQSPFRHQLAHMTKRHASPRPLRYKSKGPTKPGGI